MIGLAKWAVFTLMVSTLWGAEAQANTINAASCGQNDVQNALNLAKNGDTVLVPAGTCTWSAAVSTSGKGYTLQGAGAGSTVILHNLASGASLLITVPSGSSLRITGMTVQPASTTTNYNGFMSISGGATSVRVDHMAFTGWTFANVSNGRPLDFDNVFGVVDHCTFSGAFAQLIGMKNDSWNGAGNFGDKSWAQPTGFGSANALYIEDNTFTNTTPQNGAQIVTDCDAAGCRYVIRYNTFISYGIGHHGTESAGRSRGGRQWEVYNNTFSCDASGNQSCNTTAMIRSGTGLYFNNTINSVNGSLIPNWNSAANFMIFRISNSINQWATCDGLGPWDNNDGVVYASGSYTGSNGGTTLIDSTKNWKTGQWFQNGSPYSIVNTTQGYGAEITGNTSNTIVYSPAIPGFGGLTTWNSGDSYQILRASYCIDQPGRGQGVLISGDPPTPKGSVQEALEPIYIWNNDITHAGFAGPMVGSNSARLLPDRDYYVQTPSFNGTSGTGTGLLSARPSSCTPAVAYWATDTNTLYKCTATDTWTAFYTPYTHPHPLTQGSGTKTGSNPNPPTGLEAVVQ
jgi:hypothetical protein